MTGKKGCGSDTLNSTVQRQIRLDNIMGQGAVTDRIGEEGRYNRVTAFASRGMPARNVV
jgi:hypothetical protein